MTNKCVGSQEMHYNTNKCSTENQLWRASAIWTQQNRKTTRRNKERIQCTLHKTTLHEPRSRKATCIKTKRKRLNLDVCKTKTTTRTNERNTANATPKCKHKSQGQATSSACKHANVQESHNTFSSTVRSQGHESLDATQDTRSATSNLSEITIEKHIMELCTTSRAKRQVIFSPQSAHCTSDASVSNLGLKK